MDPFAAGDEGFAGVNLSPHEAGRCPDHGAANGAYSPAPPLSPAPTPTSSSTTTVHHSYHNPAVAAASSCAAACASAEADGSSSWSVLLPACCLRAPATAGRGVEDTCGNGFDFGLRSTSHTAKHRPFLPYFPVLVLVLALLLTLVCQCYSIHRLFCSRLAHGGRRLDEPRVSGGSSGSSSRGTFIVAFCNAVPGRL